MMSVGDLASVGTAEGWPGGVAGLPEQARGIASATPSQNPFANPIVNPATASNIVNLVTGTSSSTVPQSDITANATGNYVSPSIGPEIVNGWPINIPPIVDPLGTVGWLMGLPELARGTAQATVME